MSILFRYLDTFPRPAGIPEWPEIIPPITADQLDAAIAAGATAVRRSRRGEQGGGGLRPRPAPSQLSFGMLSTSIARESCEEAVETFGKHVLKNFDKDPVHNTTKQRLAAGGK